MIFMWSPVCDLGEAKESKQESDKNKQNSLN